MKLSSLPAIKPIVDETARLDMVDQASEYWFETNMRGLSMIETTRASAKVLTHKLEVSFSWLHNDPQRGILVIAHIKDGE